MKKRELGLDLLRCLALFLVFSYHFFLYNFYHEDPQTGVFMWLAGSYRSLSLCCIGIFLMLTGYLKSEKTDFKACYRGILPVVAGYLIAAVISIPLRHFIFGEKHGFLEWAIRLFNFNALYYGWYVPMYIGLVLLIPFLNRLISGLNNKQLLLLAVVMLLLTAVPGATKLSVSPDFWDSLYPLTYYILGAIVKRLQPKLKSWMGIAGALSMALIMGAVTVLSTNGPVSNGQTWKFGDIWVVGMVLCLFVSLYRVQIRPGFGRILSFAAGGCYGGYLLSHLFDAWVYRLFPNWLLPQWYVPLFLCATVPAYILSILLGVALEKVARFFEKR